MISYRRAYCFALRCVLFILGTETETSSFMAAISQKCGVAWDRLTMSLDNLR